MPRTFENRFIVFLALVVALIVLPGCVAGRFQREHEGSVVHIFGIGWVMTSTNKTRAFAIGSLDAGHHRLTVNTNAPVKFKP